MRSTIAVLICATLATSGCARVADSRFNPLNWFGSSTVSAPTDATGTVVPLVSPQARNRSVDARPLVSTITGLEIARTPDGGILRATGTAPTGAFNAQLVPVSQEGGTLTLAFRAEQGPGQGGRQTITVARLFSNAELAGIRRVVVQGQQNTASTTR